MSGGTFEYAQYRIRDIIDSVKEIIKNNNKKVPNRKHDWEAEYYSQYSKETINEFKKGLKYLKLAQIYAQRIDWLIAGDDGEETFHERLKEDLNEAKL